MSLKIKDFEDLIIPCLRSDQIYKSYQCEKLLSSGENYGSIMLRVEVKVITQDGEEEIVHCVAKSCPPPGHLWEVFNTKETFKAEINIYKEIAPALNQFGREKGIDCLIHFLPGYIGSRISTRKDSNDVDEDGVILLENLKVNGYGMGDRFAGFDLESTKLILTDLATMHAAPIAYRFTKPEEFKSKILPYIGKCYVFEVDDDTIEELIRLTRNNTSENLNCIPHMEELEKAIRRINISQMKHRSFNEIFATLVHNDYWVNNTMLKYENGNLVKNKILDFQINDYSSLAHDVIFFLYTSVELPLLEENLDELFRFYHRKLIENLIKLGCDVCSCGFEDFMDECAAVAGEFELPHILMILPIIFTLKEKAVELTDIQGDDMIIKGNALHENFAKRLQFILLDFVKRKWI